MPIPRRRHRPGSQLVTAGRQSGPQERDELPGQFELPRVRR